MKQSISEADNLDWRTYESITRYIYESLGKQSGVKIKGYGNSCKEIGKSGVSHQIDVLTTHSDGIHTYKTAIECKYWKDRINKDIIMKLSETINDTGIHKGIIVSKNGFTKDGIEFAKFRNIELVELRQIEEKDLNEIPEQIDIGSIEIKTSARIWRPEILTIDVGNDQRLDIKNGSDFFDFIVSQESGVQIPLTTYIDLFKDEINRQNKESEKITKYYEVSRGALINRQNNTSIAINGITFTGQLTEIDACSNMRIKLVDQVWLIMKSIFDERSFTFSENGLIIEHKK